MKIYKITIAVLATLLITACSKSKLFEYPSNGSTLAEITNFSIVDANGQSVSTNIQLLKDSRQVLVTVKNGTDLTKLVPRSSISEGVVIEPVMGVYTNFSEHKTYILTAGDKITKNEWTVIVSKP
jgi:hypothetical protein